MCLGTTPACVVPFHLFTTLAPIPTIHRRSVGGQAVVVENRTGANGNIAMAAVAKSPPDGYTLALVPVGNAAVNPSLFADLPYEMGQFAPITQIANVENVLVTSAKSQIKSLQPKARIGAKTACHVR
jgi:tripartite-type tricarboxylate transporter receptor subunit TctC